MDQSLPFLPGYTFRDITKTNFGYPRTLVYSKGVAVPQPIASTTVKTALELLDAQNEGLDREKVTELTYGPKRFPPKETILPRYLALDKKVLRFDGYFREDVGDWSNESYRIRKVKVLYYLQNDTMEVIEPYVPNSGLVQGTMFKRQVLPHPKGNGRQYLWKDLNIGVDLMVYGISIHLTDCDPWSREYLINAGIELNEAESTPLDPYEQRKYSNAQWCRKEVPMSNVEDAKLYKFLTCDRKVIRFYGTWKDVISDPPEIRRVILQYYLADDTMELLEDHAPNCGRLPFKVLIKKQKIPVDRNELPEDFPRSYMELKDDDAQCLFRPLCDVVWFRPEDFRTGKNIVILGKKVFLYDCDPFTRHYYKEHFGIDDMECIEVLEKPKPQTPKIFPPHNGIGTWDDSLQNCISLFPRRPKKDLMKEIRYDGKALRYKAEMVTPIPEERNRSFVVTFFPSDDTVSINEESIPNSGFPGGAFLKRTPLPKPDSNPACNPQFYTTRDFGIGQEIRACGKLFKLKDADRFVMNFMEQNPELFTVEQVQAHKKYTKKPDEYTVDHAQKEKSDLIDNMREEVVRRYGSSQYPLPSCLEPACDLQYKEKTLEELYSSNIPIPMDLIRKAVDKCTDYNERTDMAELRKILLPALGHSIKN
ncbi:hypothetical protein JTE90_017217 [Oedothorax gibbosus]|uniref:DM10 domain-containing protein n=1 Tax=Oedothorax gibbosus TaxID=931172 RepID=A0AAV6VDE4_9ARAC|nr:hypothetical protein JTE90_017217 [Oedothorax gibbosus]